MHTPIHRLWMRTPASQQASGQATARRQSEAQVDSPPFPLNLHLHLHLPLHNIPKHPPTPTPA